MIAFCPWHCSDDAATMIERLGVCRGANCCHVMISVGDLVERFLELPAREKQEVRVALVVLMMC